MPRTLLLTRFSALAAALLLAACAPAPPRGDACPPCAPTPPTAPAKPAEKALQPADWTDLPDWARDDLAVPFTAFRDSCRVLDQREQWSTACRAARAQADLSPAALRAWFEREFRPWVAVNADGGRTGLVTGYYEPVVTGSRQRSTKFSVPAFAPPDDLVVVDLTELYPELKHLRLRGRLEGRRLVPYYSRAEWAGQESRRSLEGGVLAWLEDPVEFFFLQIQGSGRVELAEGGQLRLGYADQNGHPYRSIGRWLIDRGEILPHEASMQGIQSWARANPQRLAELLNANPSLVFFRELAADGSGPPGALGVPLTAERSIAVDPRHIPLGAPVWLATTRPNSDLALTRLMLAQDTGGAIRGAVRADFFWGGGAQAGMLAGRMKQTGRMWVLLPKAYTPD